MSFSKINNHINVDKKIANGFKHLFKAIKYCADNKISNKFILNGLTRPLGYSYAYETNLLYENLSNKVMTKKFQLDFIEKFKSGKPTEDGKKYLYGNVETYHDSRTTLIVEYILAEMLQIEEKYTRNVRLDLSSLLSQDSDTIKDDKSLEFLSENPTMGDSIANLINIYPCQSNLHSINDKRKPRAKHLSKNQEKFRTHMFVKEHAIKLHENEDTSLKSADLPNIENIITSFGSCHG